MPNFASLSCFYSKLRWGGFFAPPPPVQNRVPEYPIQNRVNTTDPSKNLNIKDLKNPLR